IPEGTTVQVTGLPDGLTQNGWVISGTPTRAGEYDVLVTVSNSGDSRSQKVKIEVTDEGGDATTPAVSTARRRIATRPAPPPPPTRPRPTRAARPATSSRRCPQRRATGAVPARPAARRQQPAVGSNPSTARMAPA